MTVFSFTTALYIVETVATIAFALSGVIEAARRRMDAVGVCVVAGLAAFGGRSGGLTFSNACHAL